jgi:hypothetical protein
VHWDEIQRPTLHEPKKLETAKADMLWNLKEVNSSCRLAQEHIERLWNSEQCCCTRPLCSREEIWCYPFAVASKQAESEPKSVACLKILPRLDMEFHGQEMS